MKSPKMAAFVAVQVVVLIVQVMLLRATLLASSSNHAADSPVRDAAYEVQEQTSQTDANSLKAARQMVVRGVQIEQGIAKTPEKLALTDLYIVDGDGLPLIHLGASSGTARIEMYDRRGNTIYLVEYDGDGSVSQQIGHYLWSHISVSSSIEGLMTFMNSPLYQSSRVEVFGKPGLITNTKTPLDGHDDFFVISERSHSGSGVSGPGAARVYVSKGNRRKFAGNDYSVLHGNSDLIVENWDKEESESNESEQ